VTGVQTCALPISRAMGYSRHFFERLDALAATDPEIDR